MNNAAKFFDNHLRRETAARGRMLCAFLKITRQHPKPQQLHKLRVASRRLQAAIRIWQIIATQPKSRTIVQTLQKMRRESNTLRDIDVGLEDFETLPADLKKQTTPIIRYLQKEQKRHQKIYKKILQQNTGELEKKISRIIMNQPPKNVTAKKIKKIHEMLKQKHKTILAIHKKFLQKYNHQTMHRLRILVKNERYIEEICKPLIKNYKIREQKAIKLQRLLGRMHDFSMHKILIKKLYDQKSGKNLTTFFQKKIAEKHATLKKLYVNKP